MTKTVKMFEGIRLTVDTQSEAYFDRSPSEVLDVIHIPEEAKTDVFRALICNGGHLDLSYAYEGHKVTLDIIPCKEAHA